MYHNSVKLWDIFGASFKVHCWLVMVDASGLVQNRMMELASCQFVLGYNGVNAPPIQHAQQY